MNIFYNEPKKCYTCFYFRGNRGFVSKVLLYFVADRLNAYESNKFFSTNITILSSGLTIFMVVVVAIVTIVVHVIFVSTIRLTKSTL